MADNVEGTFFHVAFVLPTTYIIYNRAAHSSSHPLPHPHLSSPWARPPKPPSERVMIDCHPGYYILYARTQNTSGRATLSTFDLLVV